MRETKPNIHLDLYYATAASDVRLGVIAVVGLIAYMVRAFSYTEAGPIYGASAVFGLAGLYFFFVHMKRIKSGKTSVYYRKNYSGLNRWFRLFFNAYLFGLGIFLGNIAYYISRFRIWSEPEQIGRMFTEAMNPTGMGIGLFITALTYFYLFRQDKFIESKDYAKRMYYKMNHGRLTEHQAYIEVIQEQDRFRLYGIQTEETPSKSVSVPKTVTAATSRDQKEEYDIYAEARIKRGE